MDAIHHRRSFELGAGRVLQFGVGVGARNGSIAITPGAHGHLTVQRWGWAVTNHSPRKPLRIESMERPAEFMTVLPRQADVPVPWDLAYVAGSSGRVLRVFGPSPAEAECATPNDDADVSGANALSLRPGTGYYRVVRALVANRLYGDYSSPLPTSKEIGSQLGVPVRNVNAQIHYLTEKFRLTPLGGHHRPGWRREALADHIIKNSLLMADRIGEGSQEWDHTQGADHHEVGSLPDLIRCVGRIVADDHTSDVQLALGPQGRQVAQVVTGEHDGMNVKLCDEAAQHSALSMPDGRSFTTKRPAHDLEPVFGADLFGPVGAGPHSDLQGSGI